MDHNIIKYIISLLDYQTLYAAIQVNKYWHQASQNQINISHQTNIILPILHNSAIHDDFIDNLYELYYNYLIQTNTSFHNFLHYINGSSTYGYDDDNFMDIFNKYDKINLLFEHVIQHLHVIIKDVDHIPEHRLDIYIHNTSLFEKGFAILAYFKSSLNRVRFYRFDPFTYNKIVNYSIRWNTNMFQNKIFD